MKTTSLRRAITRLRSDVRGATTTEYALLIGLIAAGMFYFVSTIGQGLSQEFASIGDEVDPNPGSLSSKSNEAGNAGSGLPDTLSSDASADSGGTGSGEINSGSDAVLGPGDSGDASIGGDAVRSITQEPY